MSGQTTQQQRDEHWRQGSDVYQHTYAFHHAVLPTAKRSPDADDEADALYYYALVNEATDRKLAEALRRGAARIRALEAALFAKTPPTEGKTE